MPVCNTCSGNGYVADEHDDDIDCATCRGTGVVGTERAERAGRTKRVSSIDFGSHRIGPTTPDATPKCTCTVTGMLMSWNEDCPVHPHGTGTIPDECIHKSYTWDDEKREFSPLNVAKIPTTPDTGAKPDQELVRKAGHPALADMMYTTPTPPKQGEGKPNILQLPEDELRALFEKAANESAKRQRELIDRVAAAGEGKYSSPYCDCPPGTTMKYPHIHHPTPTQPDFQESVREILVRQFNPDCEHGITCMQEHFEHDTDLALAAITEAVLRAIGEDEPTRADVINKKRDGRNQLRAELRKSIGGQHE